LTTTTPAPSPQTEAPRAFAALRHSGYAAYLVGSSLAMGADAIEHVISYWVIFEKFHSPALGGYAVISHWLPFLLFSIYSGALADRFDPRRIIQAGMVLFMLCSLAWGVLILTDTLAIWHAVVILAVHGIAGVLWAPASQLLIHDIVGRERLYSAVRLMAISRTLGQLAGPAVGGVLLLALGPSRGILLNVLIYLPLALWLWRAPYGPRFRDEPAPAHRRSGGLADTIATARDIAGNHILVSMTLVAGATSLLVGNAYQPQMPEFASDIGQGDTGVYYSMLLGANAAGALVAGIVLETWGLMNVRPRVAFVLAALWSLCMIGFASSRIYLISLALLFAAGILNLAFSSISQTLVQLHAPNVIRGRVLGLYNMCSNGTRAFSGVTVGMMGSLIGIHWSLGVSALTLLLVTLALLALDRRTKAVQAAE
jgi:MFS family permease